MANGTLCVEGCLLVGGHEVGLVLQPNVASQARAVDENLAAEGALLRNVVVFALLQKENQVVMTFCMK